MRSGGVIIVPCCHDCSSHYDALLVLFTLFSLSQREYRCGKMIERDVVLIPIVSSSYRSLHPTILNLVYDTTTG